MTDAQQRKQALLDALAPIVDGEEAAVQAFADALAADDDLRDLRHEAADITALLSETGADYQPPADMQARVLAAIDAEPAAAPPRLAASQGLGAPAAAPDGPNAPAAPISLARWRARPELRARVFGLTCALAAAAALVMVLRQRPSDGTAPMVKMAAEPDSDSRIVALVGPTPARGFGVRLQQGAAGRARRALPGSTLGAGSVLATDAWTRVRLRLSDGSKLVIDRDSSVRFESLHAHRVHLRRGQLLATVAKRQARARPALYRTRHGEVEVRGTQFQLSTSVSESHVRLLRGSVILRSHSGRQRRLRPGQEGVMDRQG
ncbi:MAG: FecR domain-containing protein, partial [Polyangiales bacterium]